MIVIEYTNKINQQKKDVSPIKEYCQRFHRLSLCILDLPDHDLFIHLWKVSLVRVNTSQKLIISLLMCSVYDDM